MDKNYTRQPGNLGVPRGVVAGVAEEARTRGIASLTFARFAFFYAVKLRRLATFVNQMNQRHLLLCLDKELSRAL